MHYIAGAALQAVMDFFQILVTSGNSEVDFHRLFEVTAVASFNSVCYARFYQLGITSKISSYSGNK